MSEFTPKEVGCIVGAYTGILCGKMGDLHEYIEKLLGRSVWTHELGNKAMSEDIKKASAPDFMRLTLWCVGEKE